MSNLSANESNVDLLRFFKALADETRLKMAALLASKPHLAKPAGTPPPPGRPAPDPSQGRGGNNPPADFRTADKAAFDAELAKYGLRPQSHS